MGMKCSTLRLVGRDSGAEAGLADAGGPACPPGVAGVRLCEPAGGEGDARLAAVSKRALETQLARQTPRERSHAT